MRTHHVYTVYTRVYTCTHCTHGVQKRPTNRWFLGGKRGVYAPCVHCVHTRLHMYTLYTSGPKTTHKLVVSRGEKGCVHTMCTLCTHVCTCTHCTHRVQRRPTNRWFLGGKRGVCTPCVHCARRPVVWLGLCVAKAFCGFCEKIWRRKVVRFMRGQNINNKCRFFVVTRFFVVFSTAGANPLFGGFAPAVDKEASAATFLFSTGGLDSSRPKHCSTRTYARGSPYHSPLAEMGRAKHHSVQMNNIMLCALSLFHGKPLNPRTRHSANTKCQKVEMVPSWETPCPRHVEPPTGIGDGPPPPVPRKFPPLCSKKPHPPRYLTILPATAAGSSVFPSCRVPDGNRRRSSAPVTRQSLRNTARNFIPPSI